MIDSNHTLLLFFLIIIQSVDCRVQVSVDVPNIFKENQEQWFVIKSKQITRIIKSHPKESSWLVEDHFHLSKGISYSLYTNKRNPNETYSLIAYQGGGYYATTNDGDWSSDQVDCQLDHRQDHRTLFPWKYARVVNGPDKHKFEASDPILGFGAVWLNLIDQKVKCHLSAIDEQILDCHFDDRSRRKYVKLSFKWPIESTNGLVMPKSAHLSRTQTIRLDGLDLTQYVTIDVSDILVTNFQSINTERCIENLLRLCKTSVMKKEVQFPSLIKSIDNSYRQSYYLHYIVKLHDSNEQSQDLSNDSSFNNLSHVVNKAVFNYQEWFSSKYEAQTMMRKNSSNELNENEKFYSLFKYRMPEAKRNLIYKTKFFENQQPSSCDIVIDDERDNRKLFSISHLFTREMHFSFDPDIKESNSKQRHDHSGYLIGLGALLMNVADIQNKKIAPTISKTNQSIIMNRWHSNLEWVIEDIDSAHNFHFFFRSHPTEEHKLEIDDLTKIEIRKMTEKTSEKYNNEQKDNDEIVIANDGLDEEEQSKNEEYSNLLLMTVDLVDFSTSLYQDQINLAFILPEICNFDENKMEENVDNDENEDDDKIPIEETKKPDGDCYENYEFPYFEQYLQLAKDYVIHSEWNLDDGTYLKVVEYLMIDTNEEQDRDELFARLDITRATNELEVREDYSIYLRYSDNIMIKHEDGNCSHPDKLDDWLEALASREIYADYNRTLDDSNMPTIKFYGLGALWKLVSSGWMFTDYLGQFSGQDDPDQSNQKTKLDYALWRYNHYSPDFKILFKFYLLDLNQIDIHKRLKLAWIQIDTSHISADITTLKTVNSIRIENVIIETSSATKLYFMLPSSCDPIFDQAAQEAIKDEPKFPTFFETFNAPPSSANFELKYTFMMSFKDMSYQATVIESKGLLSLFIGRNAWRIWLLDGSRTLLEQKSSGRCKTIPALNIFFNLQDFIDIIAANFDHIKQGTQNSLLADLWNLFGLRVNQERISSSETGSRLKIIAHAKFEHQHINSHQKLIEWTIRDDSDQTSASITFKHLHANDTELTLHSLILSSPKYILRFMNHYSPRGLNDITMPITCSDLSNDETFPHLSRQLEKHSNEAMHLRSEVISRSPLGNDNMLQLLDEWLKLSDLSYRSHSRGLREATEVRDYLIYGETREFFDLSTKFKCSTLDFDSDTNSKKKPSVKIQPVDNFIIRELLYAVGNNGGAFYHPLALWFFAEQPEVERNLVQDSDINLKDLFNQTTVSSWLYTERWNIEHKEFRNLKYTLSFSNEFDGHEQRTVLNKLETLDWRKDIVVEVVNYKHIRHITSDTEEFLIPKGRGCRRNDQAKKKYLKNQLDVLVLERLNPIQFDYTASLETSGGSDDLISLSPRPVFHSGWFGKCPSSWTLEPICALKVHHERRHYLNGTMKSKRHIISGEHIDPFIVQVRSLDENSGYCSVRAERKSNENHLLDLDFNIDGLSELDLIQVKDLPFFDVITLGLPGYELIQWEHIVGEDNESDITRLVYELRVSNFSLNRQLSGETSLVRTFERRADMKAAGNFFYHSKAKLEVMVENKAKFTMNIENLGYKECLNTLSRSKTLDCYRSTEFFQYDSRDELRFRPKVRSFQLVYYPIDNDLNEDIYSPPKEYTEMSKSIFETKKSDIEKSFVEDLLKLPVNLSATQLGQVQVSYKNEDKSIHVSFDLMEPPSALEYFEELQNRKMKPNSLLLSPMKLLDSKYSCSRWCDEENCSAFSYCSDRSCEILVLDSGSRTGLNRKYDIEELNSIIDLAEDNTCSYYRAPIYQPKEGLNKAISFLRENSLLAVAGDEAKRAKYLLKLTIIPSHSKSQIEFVARKLIEVTNDAGITNKQTRTTELQRDTYMFLKEQSQISGSALEKQRKVGRKFIRYHLIREKKLASCFSECSTIDCQLLSYCNGAQTCILITNMTSSYDFRSVVYESTEQNNDCSIYGRDFLVGYEKFTDTRPPSSWKGFFNNISLIECASICEFETSKQPEADIDCLSFDYCLTETDERTETPFCFIQDMHIIMNDFDIDNIMPTEKHQVQTYCSHYSKSLLADFSQYFNKKFSNHNSIIFNGIDIEKCTLICRRDELCLGFEYCGSNSSCFILRQQDEIEQDFSSINQLVDEKPSKKCSVFKLKHIEEKFRIKFGEGDSANIIEPIDEPKFTQWWCEARTSLICDILILLGFSFIAMVFGAILNISLIIIARRKQ